MATVNLTTKIIDIELNYNAPSVLNESCWSIIIIFFLLFIIAYIAIQSLLKRRNIEPVELTLGIGKSSFKYKILRNYENLEIAHRIYIELITRKAAIPFDEENDVISEVYNSWYTLFKITREEIKKLPGQILQDSSKSQELIKMATDILNDGLRPHLTIHQARFRKWYSDELEKDENKEKNPQEIQRNYPDYDKLVQSMKQVNTLLVDYADQLNKFITGKNPN